MLPKINGNFLKDYRDREREHGEALAGALLRSDFTIRNARAVYPEYELKEPFGIHRPGVNIALLMFFYRQVVAYVPPMTQNDFKQRFGIPYFTFLRLAYPESDMPRFIFPVLNHPRRYSAQYIRIELEELLAKMPPTWERWHAALELTGGDVWFERSDKRFNYPAMWTIPELRALWRKRLQTTSETFVSREIKQQIRNNYTDLCLVGRESQANEIAEASNMDPEYAVNDLFYSSDLYAYPEVMGAGGIANVRASQGPLVIRDRSLSDIKRILPPAEYFDSEVIEALLRGLKFDLIPKEFQIDFLLAWHQSTNAERARTAYHALLECARLKSPSLDRLHETMKMIIHELEEFCHNAEPTTEDSLRQTQNRESIVSGISALGGIPCTIAGLFLLDVLMAGLGVGFTLIGLKKWATRERVIEKLLKKYAADVPIDLYRNYAEIRSFSEDFFRRIQASPGGTREVEDKTVTSVPLRTVWWID